MDGITVLRRRWGSLNSFWSGTFYPIQKSFQSPRTPVSPPKSLLSYCGFLILGFALLVIGQFFRSAAMIEASSNFSHKIAEEKKSSHELVTSGVYSLVRHPSYFGFFWWSIGTQVFLANPLATVVFMGVLWRFFSARIQYRPSFLVLVLGCNFLTVKSRGETFGGIFWRRVCGLSETGGCLDTIYFIGFHSGDLFASVAGRQPIQGLLKTQCLNCLHDN